MSGATSISRQSVWEFTELWRYCVKLPVWSCLWASGPAAAADDGWTRLAAPTIDLLPPTILHRQQTRDLNLFQLWLVGYGSPFTGETCWGKLDWRRKNMSPGFSAPSPPWERKHVERKRIALGPLLNRNHGRCEPLPASSFLHIILCCNLICCFLFVCNTYTQCWCFNGEEAKWQWQDFLWNLI